MEEKEFEKEYKKLLKFMKKEKITGFLGFGMFPQGKGDLFKVWDQLRVCLEHEPFVEYVRMSMGLTEEED